MTTLVWDALDRLMSLTEPDGTVWTYTYDALDRRVRIAVDNGTTVSVRAVSYDAKLAVALWSWDGSTWRVVEDYVVGAGFGEVLAKSTPSGPQYALRDHLQTPVAWVGADGVVSETLRDSYGVRADGGAGITVTEPYGYTGHAEDGHGLVWGRARWLDNARGGWLSEDTVTAEPRYSYSWNSPSWSVDPDGNASLSSLAATVEGAKCRSATSAANLLRALAADPGILFGSKEQTKAVLESFGLKVYDPTPQSQGYTAFEITGKVLNVIKHAPHGNLTHGAGYFKMYVNYASTWVILHRPGYNPGAAARRSASIKVECRPGELTRR